MRSARWTAKFLLAALGVVVVAVAYLWAFVQSSAWLVTP